MIKSMINQTVALDKDLIEYAIKFYKTNLSKNHINNIVSMDYGDKVWLLDQYKQEVSFDTVPDLSSIY